VDALHRGDHATITAALQAAKPGTQILVRPGLYRVRGDPRRPAGNPTVRRNCIREEDDAGVSGHTSGQGMFEDNEISANILSGCVDSIEREVGISSNRISRNTALGVAVMNEGGKRLRGEPAQRQRQGNLENRQPAPNPM